VTVSSANNHFFNCVYKQTGPSREGNTKRRHCHGPGKTRGAKREKISSVGSNKTLGVPELKGGGSAKKKKGGGSLTRYWEM